MNTANYKCDDPKREMKSEKIIKVFHGLAQNEQSKRTTGKTGGHGEELTDIFDMHRAFDFCIASGKLLRVFPVVQSFD